MKNKQVYIFIFTILIVISAVVFFGINNKSKNNNTALNTVDTDLLPSSPDISYSQNTIPDTVTNSNTEEKKPIINNKQKIMNATFKTNKGSFTVELLTNDAPKTTANFIKLAESSFYNGVKFHRVIKDFMIQSGDPLTKDDTMMSRWGTGGPGYQFADEIHANNKNVAGTIAMANAGPNTNGSQFFINTNDNNFLDTKHTVFGRVTSGMDVVTKIENTATDQMDRPLDAVIIESITLK